MQLLLVLTIILLKSYFTEIFILKLVFILLKNNWLPYDLIIGGKSLSFSNSKNSKSSLQLVLYLNIDLSSNFCILDDIIKDFIEQVVLMNDRELKEDRSEWLKVYGGYNEKDEYKYETCIHTLAIEIEQLRRYGKIIYDVKDKEFRLG